MHMGLPEVIEIVPPAPPLCAGITVPGSKSITNRALVLAALSSGETTLRGALWSEDTQVMIDCLRELGFMVNLAPDPHDACNRTITVYGKQGRVPQGGTETQPLELFVGNAGTATRFLLALLCLGSGFYRLHGVPRMHERPQAALLQALRQLGYRLEAADDRLPVTIRGKGASPGRCRVSIAESSQFASALLLCASAGSWQVEVTGENAEESPYVAMTSRLVEVFPGSGGEFVIEPDASSASYFWAADVLLHGSWGRRPLPNRITVEPHPASDWQIDAQFPAVISSGATRVSRQSDLGDSILSAMILAPLAPAPIEFADLGRLRLQECERVMAMRNELTKCGVEVVERGDSLFIHPAPGRIHGAVVETYSDHRIAMCFGILGLKVPGIRIQNPACVKKTFPNFFEKLAGAPPFGLGAPIKDATTDRVLSSRELFAC
jgi:3-phosphoshikimate 1-carboxyvinyltransferase